ncbi:DMT family transporter [Sediminivirga luteola]|uniref:Magnesium transporter NIPA n=1 Tax=Sediminivirga luteola TaxID=1774748 RepID=A0A8J2TXB6_9MICO|nr:DMT family transporter [Sediminivirga luteola]GGA12191.1 hypothetical protein GCM10011333_13770 [Sediminivirga luteola]
MYLTAISLAVFAALFLALGTHLQHHAVATAPRADGASVGARMRGLLLAARSPLWLLGLALIGAEIVLNVLALGLGPVALVQPLGMLSLVAAVVISAFVLRRRLGLAPLAALAGTVLAVGLFVGLSSGYARPLVLEGDTATRLGGLILVFTLLGAGIAVSSARHVMRVVTAGVLFGSVASGAHVLAHSFLHGGPSALPVAAWWTLLAGVALGSAAGTWVVQTAYASGPPETVLAGLTVVDPIVAVTIGAGVLGEYAGATPAGSVALLGTAAAAIAGVFALARLHPSVQAGPSPGGAALAAPAAPVLASAGTGKSTDGGR